LEESLVCSWLSDDLLDELEAFTDESFGFFKEAAVMIGRVARQVAPIATAIPIPQAKLIGEAAELISNMLADAIDAVPHEWRIGLDDSRR
jgi:hypothetical protein